MNPDSQTIARIQSWLLEPIEIDECPVCPGPCHCAEIDRADARQGDR